MLVCRNVTHLTTQQLMNYAQKNILIDFNKILGIIHKWLLQQLTTIFRQGQQVFVTVKLQFRLVQRITGHASRLRPSQNRILTLSVAICYHYLAGADKLDLQGFPMTMVINHIPNEKVFKIEIN